MVQGSMVVIAIKDREVGMELDNQWTLYNFRNRKLRHDMITCQHHGW